MKAFFAIFILSWVLTLFMPWWALFIPAIIIGSWLLNRGFMAFIIGFCGSGLAWYVQAYYVHFFNEGILTTRIADMMGIGSPWVVLLITFAIGGIPGGFGALTGYIIKINLKRPAVKAAAGN